MSKPTLNSAGLLLMLAVGFAGAVIIGVVYGVVVAWMPLIYVNIVLTALCGGGVGAVVVKGGEWGRCYQQGPILAVGLLAGLLALGVSWVTWFWALSHFELLVLDPGTMVAMARERLEFGAWSMSGYTPTGAALGVIWALEALFIVGGVTWVAWLDMGPTDVWDAVMRGFGSG